MHPSPLLSEADLAQLTQALPTPNPGNAPTEAQLAEMLAQVNDVVQVANAALDHAQRLAHQHGWLATRRDNLLAFRFQAPHGPENIYVKYWGTDDEGRPVLQFATDSLRTPADLEQATGFAYYLMDRNGSLRTARWVLERAEGGAVFTLISTALVQGLDAEGLRSAIVGLLAERGRAKTGALASATTDSPRL